MTLRVLHVRTSAALAGPESQILELARSLPESGVSAGVALFVRTAREATAGHPLVRALTDVSCPCWPLEDPGFDLDAGASALATVVERHAADLVHAHDYKANAIVRRLALRRRAATLATVHLHTRTTLRLRLWAALDRRQLRGFPAVILVARSLERDPAVRSLEAARRYLVHNGVDPARLAARARGETAASRAELAAAGEGPRLLAVGRLTAQKGLDLLLDAGARLLPRFPDLRIAVAGTGPEGPRLVARARRQGLASTVRWLGERRDVAGLMAAADLVVIPSRAEGLPYVALEALALGRPLIATAVGGLPELVRDGVEGRLVAPRDAAALADAIADALARPEVRREWGRRGRERVEESFHAREMGRATADVYRRLVA